MTKKKKKNQHDTSEILKLHNVIIDLNKGSKMYKYLSLKEIK